MHHLTSVLMGGLAAVGAWAMVAPSSAPASRMPGVGGLDAQVSVNRAAKGDRLAPPPLQGRNAGPALPEVPRGSAHPPIPVGCDPVFSNIAEPGLSPQLSHLTGHCAT